MTLVAAPPAIDRETLRARVFLRAVLPLAEVLVAEVPALARLFRGVTATVQIAVSRSPMGAALVFTDGALHVEDGVRSADLTVELASVRALNAFFAGKLAWPRLRGFRPLLVWKTVRLLLALRLLDPKSAPATAELRALRVKLLLFLVTRALAELHRGGHPEMVELVENSPERIYQWTVGAGEIAAYLRMEAGRVKAGRGVYGRRRPFVHFEFPDTASALAVLTASRPQIDAVREGKVRTSGSPEYTRKVSLLMQKVDELLQEG